MENFLKPFIGKGVFFSLENFINKDSTEFSYVKCLQSLIFKQDVIFELKQILSSACASESFTVKNDLTKKMIVHLNLLILSDEDTEAKADVFRYVFKTFVSICKDDNVHIMQFFTILSHLLGMNLVPNVNESNETDDGAINLEGFNSAFEVNISNPSPVTFLIFKDLLLCLSKLSFNFNSLEIQHYRKWLQRIIKNLAYFKPFQNEFLEIFSVCADIDLKLLEGNLEHIFCNVLQAPVNEEFCDLYGTFLEKALDICSKFQKTIKFIAKFLSSFRVTQTLLPRETILPPNVMKKFSQIVTVASNQQSLSLLDFLVQNLDECFVVISQGNSGSNPLLFSVSSQLLVSFFKDVKLYAPSISSATLVAFMDKLSAFRESLHKFGAYLFNNTQFISKNGDVVTSFLDLCIYCGEIKMLVDCYKDSLLQPSDAKLGETEHEWHCCLDSQQWESLIRIVLKSKLEALSPSCFRLALQKCRESKLNNEIPHTDESTLKIIFSQLTSGMKNFNIFQQLPPEDLTIVMDMLSVKQSKSLCKRILTRLLENDDSKDEEWTAWLSSPVLQENPLFVLNIFSLILQETGRVLLDFIPDKRRSEVSWLSDKYFEDGSILPGSLDGLPEKMNCLLKSGKKVRKSLGKNPQQKDAIVRLIRVFKGLPLPHMKGDCRKLGLCFALTMGVLLTDDENSVCLPFESLCSFFTSDVDASTCFDLGLCVGWLSGVAYEDEKVNQVKVKLMEVIVRTSPKTEFGLIQLGTMIDSTERPKGGNLMKMLESRVVLHNELGKCRQRAKKRKSDNDLILSYRSKLAKIISEEARQLEDDAKINPDNGKILLQILAIELNNSIKTTEEKEDMAALVDQKFLSHFDLAVKNLKINFDEPSASFLSAVLQCMPRLGKFLPEGSLFKIWKALKYHEKMNWRLFYKQSSEEEFSAIVDDLLEMSKKFLKSDSEKHSSNCLEIWVFFLEMSSGTKRQYCQIRLQDLFHYVHECDSRLGKLPIRKKLFLVKFGSFCVTKKEVTLTSHMLDTIVHVMIECLDDASAMDDFCSLFAVEVETASGIVLRQFEWSKSKIHLNFVVFKKLLASLMRRCDAGLQLSKDDVIQLSTCAFGLEKWTSLLVKRERDFARTTPYFITILISSVASVTVLPAIKVHLVNCINYFLSISDSHTVSYLMRVLKPGYQQVFNTMYNQFKKYHKYSGKV